MWSNPALFGAVGASDGALCSILGTVLWERYDQTRESLEEGMKNDQRSRKIKDWKKGVHFVYRKKSWVEMQILRCIKVFLIIIT